MSEIKLGHTLASIGLAALKSHWEPLKQSLKEGGLLGNEDEKNITAVDSLLQQLTKLQEK